MGMGLPTWGRLTWPLERVLSVLTSVPCQLRFGSGDCTAGDPNTGRARVCRYIMGSVRRHHSPLDRIRLMLLAPSGIVRSVANIGISGLKDFFRRAHIELFPCV